jgi:hypothetical protein
MSYLEIMGCSLVAPALIFALAAALVVAGRLPDSFDIVVDALPLVVFGGGVLFGLLTRRYRLVLGVVVLALADAALVNFGGRETAVAVAVLLPLNLAVIAWLGPEIPLAGRGAALFGMAFLQAGVVALLHQPALASLTASLEQPLVEADLKIWTALSQIAVLAFVMALGLALVRFLAGAASQSRWGRSGRWSRRFSRSMSLGPAARRESTLPPPGCCSSWAHRESAGAGPTSTT